MLHLGLSRLSRLLGLGALVDLLRLVDPSRLAGLVGLWHLSRPVGLSRLVGLSRPSHPQTTLLANTWY